MIVFLCFYLPPALQPDFVEIPFFDLFVRECKKYRVDLPLAIGVAYAESEFNPYALSSKGCRGIMQISPATARLYGVYNLRKLFDPEINIPIGVQHLKYCLERCNGNEKKALLLYAGFSNPRDSSALRYLERVKLAKRRAAILIEKHLHTSLIVSVSPETLSPGEPFCVVLSLKNTTSMTCGNLTVTVLTNNVVVVDTSTNLYGKVKIYPPGSRLWGKDGIQVTSRYLVIEIWTEKWLYLQTGILKCVLRPVNTDSVVLYVRGNIGQLRPSYFFYCFPSWSPWVGQQRYFEKKIVVWVRKRETRKFLP